MSKPPRLELLIAILFTISIAAVTINNNCLRELTILPGPVWEVITSADGEKGGTTVASGLEKPGAFRFEYDIGESFHSPYALIGLRREDGEVLDLSWMENVQIVARTGNHEKATFRLHFRNFEDGFSTADDFSSFKYNEGLLRFNGTSDSIHLSREDFHVPSWWVESYDRNAEESRPSFNQINAIEITTLAREGKGSLELAGLRITGHRIAQTKLIQWLLVMWMSMFFVVLLVRVWQLRIELSDSAKSARELVEANSRLADQSRELSEIACRDPLTGLFNRRGIHEPMMQLMWDWEANNKRFAVILFDLDQFKRLNDTYGHAFGDDVLLNVSQVVTDESGESDLIARWGGDEFLVVCPNLSEEKAAQLAQRLQKALSKNKLGFACSFGVSESTHGVDFNTILHQADLALYRSKTSGRNLVTAYGEITDVMVEALSQPENYEEASVLC